MVTAKEKPADKHRGFLIGTDDYMVKPVDEEEMVLRIAALLRRSREGSRIEVVEESDVAEPADPYECQYRQGAAETRHPDFEFGFLHLGQLLDLVIVHIQRVELTHRLRLGLCCHNLLPVFVRILH